MVNEDSNIDNIEIQTRKKNEKLKKQVLILKNSIEDI